MLKVTIYDGPGGSEVSYIEGVTEPGGTRKPVEIQAFDGEVEIIFDNGEVKTFDGFRSILDKITDPK